MLHMQRCSSLRMKQHRLNTETDLAVMVPLVTIVS